MMITGHGSTPGCATLSDPWQIVHTRLCHKAIWCQRVGDARSREVKARVVNSTCELNIKWQVNCMIPH